MYIYICVFLFSFVYLSIRLLFVYVYIYICALVTKTYVRIGGRYIGRQVDRWVDGRR